MSDFKFTVVKSVTLPIKKIATETAIYVKFDSAIFAGELLEQDKKSGKKEPANLVNITDLETGESMQIVVPFVLGKVLEENYNEQSYEGKCFMLIKHKMVSGKKYHTWTVKEITVG